jgi:hypothetical protein
LNRYVGKLPSILQGRTTNRNDQSSANELEGIAVEENRWFSNHFSQVEVCENCYLVYLELERHRQQISSQSKREDPEKELSEEERRQRDRALENKIFEQRKLMTKLSRSKSLPTKLEPLARNDAILRKPGKAKPRNLVPKCALAPLPWNLNDQSQRDAYYENHSNAIVKHVLNKVPILPEMSHHDQESTASKWEQLLKQKPKPAETDGQTAAAGSSSSNKNKPAINTKNYTADRLLHSWHRDMNRLRNIIHGGGKAAPDDKADHEAPISFPNREWPSNAASMNRTDSIPELAGEDEEDEEKDDDDDEEQGQLGWNPFVLA